MESDDVRLEKAVTLLSDRRCVGNSDTVLSALPWRFCMGAVGAVAERLQGHVMANRPRHGHVHGYDGTLG